MRHLMERNGRSSTVIKLNSLAYAFIQGKVALDSHFQNSSLMNEDKRCRSILFHSEGSEASNEIHQAKELRRKRMFHNEESTFCKRSPTSLEYCSSSAGLRPHDRVDELFLPGQQTLDQIVRHSLNEGRKSTCQLLGIILEETAPEELQEHATVKFSVREVLLEITKFCDLYLMERILDDESGVINFLGQLFGSSWSSM